MIALELSIFQKKERNFMLKGKRLLDSATLFSPNDCEKNDIIILKYFQWNLNKLKCIVMFVINIKSFKKLKYTFLKNGLSIFKKASLSIVYRKCGHEYKKIFKEEEDLIEILKIIGLINNIKVS